MNLRQIVLVGHVVAVPRDHVERRVRQLARPEAAHELAPPPRTCRDPRTRRPAPGSRAAARGPASRWVRAPASRNGCAVVFAQVAARRVFCKLDPELHAARHDRDLAGRDAQLSKLRRQDERALLRDEHQFAVGVPEAALDHGAVRAVDVHGKADLTGGIAAAGDGGEALDEVAVLRRHRQRIPAQAVGRCLDFRERTGAHLALCECGDTAGCMADGRSL